MKINDKMFEQYREVEIHSFAQTTHIVALGAAPAFKLLIRKVGNETYQAYAKFAQPIVQITMRKNNRITKCDELVLKEGPLPQVVSFTNDLVGLEFEIGEDEPEPETKYRCPKCGDEYFELPEYGCCTECAKVKKDVHVVKIKEEEIPPPPSQQDGDPGSGQ